MLDASVWPVKTFDVLNLFDMSPAVCLGFLADFLPCLAGCAVCLFALAGWLAALAGWQPWLSGCLSWPVAFAGRLPWLAGRLPCLAGGLAGWVAGWLAGLPGCLLQSPAARLVGSLATLAARQPDSSACEVSSCPDLRSGQGRPPETQRIRLTKHKQTNNPNMTTKTNIHTQTITINNNTADQTHVSQTPRVSVRHRSMRERRRQRSASRASRNPTEVSNAASSGAMQTERWKGESQKSRVRSKRRGPNPKGQFLDKK